MRRFLPLLAALRSVAQPRRRPSRRRRLIGALALVFLFPSAASAALSGASKSKPIEAVPAPAVEAARLGDLATIETSCAPLLSAAGPGADVCRLLVLQARLTDRAAAGAMAILSLGPLPGGTLEPFGALLRGEALLAGGEPKAALEHLRRAESADPKGPLGKSAATPLALAALQVGEHDEATRRLTKLLTSRRGDRARIRLALAQAHTKKGELDRAGVLLRAVLREHPGTEEERSARAQLEALRRAGATIAELGVEDRLRRATLFLGRGEPRPALEELAAIVPSGRGPTTLPRIALIEARAHALARDPARARVALAPALAKGVEASIAIEAGTLAGRLTMRMGDLTGALARLDAVTAAYPRAKSSEEAAFLASFFLYDVGRFEEAEARFSTFLRERPRSPRSDEARWYVAWTQYKRARFTEAEASLTALIGESPRSSLVPQAKYWKARSLERRGDVREAHAQLHTLARTPSWYGLLARSRLPATELRTLPKTLQPQAPRKALAGAAKARFARARALYEIGLLEPAGRELDAARSLVRDRDWIASFARLAADAGDYHRAYRFGTLRLGDRDGAAELAYPMAYAKDVARATEGFAVPESFIWAIMRRESGFRRAVRSPAAAVGLLQLLPRTAARITTIIGTPIAPIRLEDPTTNVLLGAWYLGELLGRFRGSYPLAAAAYNAGPPAVTRWLSDPTRKDLPLDEFVESIPFRETRHYVKGVMENHETYRALLGEPALRLTFELPKPRPGAAF